MLREVIGVAGDGRDGYSWHPMCVKKAANDGWFAYAQLHRDESGRGEWTGVYAKGKVNKSFVVKGEPDPEWVPAELTLIDVDEYRTLVRAR